MNSRDAVSFMTLGQIAKAQGIRGWLLVRSFTDPPEALLEYEQWQVVSPSGAIRTVRLEEGDLYRDRLRVRLDGIIDRDEAQALSGWWVQVARGDLPPLGEREHYREDLLGFEVRNVEAVVLGRISHFVDLPTGAVMVVRGANEHWIPAVPQHLLKVHAAERWVSVDWHED
ncbi:MAG: ribosome maturation factor RimM [Pseudomonadota bacterium]